MTNDKIYGGIAAITVCFGFILFAVWQEKAKKKLIGDDFLSIEPQQFEPFQGMQYAHWYVGHFVHRFKDLFRLGEGSSGQWSIYNQSKILMATVGYSNRIISTVRAGDRYISSVFERTFAIPVKKVVFHEFPGNSPVLTIEPLSKIQILNVDHTFTVAGKEYRLKSRPGLRQFCCDYYCQGVLAGTIAQVSLKQITIACAQQEIDPLALGFIFDLFSRYCSR